MSDNKPVNILGVEIRPRELFRGSIPYYGWMIILLLIIISGLYAYYVQLSQGLIVTGDRGEDVQRVQSRKDIQDTGL